MIQYKNKFDNDAYYSMIPMTNFIKTRQEGVQMKYAEGRGQDTNILVLYPNYRTIFYVLSARNARSITFSSSRIKTGLAEGPISFRPSYFGSQGNSFD
jgi:hypothetical protein